MRIVLTGATGNVGTAVLAALARRPEVESIVGLARRIPSLELERVSWAEADVTEPLPASLFDDADVVIHLAWAIQPSRDPGYLRRVNVEGSRAVFEAVARAGAGALVYASSVGAAARRTQGRHLAASGRLKGVSELVFAASRRAGRGRGPDLDQLPRQAGSSTSSVEGWWIRRCPELELKSDGVGNEIRRLSGPAVPSVLSRGLSRPVRRTARLRRSSRSPGCSRRAATRGSSARAEHRLRRAAPQRERGRPPRRGAASRLRAPAGSSRAAMSSRGRPRRRSPR